MVHFVESKRFVNTDAVISCVGPRKCLIESRVQYKIALFQSALPVRAAIVGITKQRYRAAKFQSALPVRAAMAAIITYMGGTC